MAVINKISGSNRNTVPGADVNLNIFAKAGDVNPLIDRVNGVITDANTVAATTATITTGTITTGTVTTLTSTTAGITTLNVSGVSTLSGVVATAKTVVRNSTPYTAATDTTAGWTLAEVKTGLIAGTIKSTTAAAVTITLDSVANIITAFATAGITLTTGSIIEFVLDNTQGANGLTLAVDGGATIAVATPVITGGATLTCSTANKLARYQLYLASATTGILSRIV